MPHAPYSRRLCTPDLERLLDGIIPHQEQPGAHLAWKKGVCHGRAAFDITFQDKTAFSLKIRNRLIDIAICLSLIH